MLLFLVGAELLYVDSVFHLQILFTVARGQSARQGDTTFH